MNGSADMEEQEIWKPVPSPYDAIYHISNFGRLKRVAKGHLNHNGVPYIIEPSKTGFKRLYRQVTLCRRGKTYGGITKNYTIHHLVAITFIGPIPPGKIIDHIDDNPTNNRYDNLQYITQPENMVKGIMRCHGSNVLDTIAENYLRRRHAEASNLQQES